MPRTAGADRQRPQVSVQKPPAQYRCQRIDLCVSVFDWAQFQRTKGAIKLHLLLDHAGYLPSFAVITTGKTHDLHVARQLEFEPGTVLVLDRDYIDYQWFVELSRRKVYFVDAARTRLPASWQDHFSGAILPGVSRRFARFQASFSSACRSKAHSTTRPRARGGRCPCNTVKLSIATNASSPPYNAWK